MASMNAATVASLLVQLEKDTDNLSTPPVERFLELYEKVYEQHLQRGGDVGAAVATVTRAFPGSDVVQSPAAGPTGGGPGEVGGGEYAQPADWSSPAAQAARRQDGPGGVVIGFGKHNGSTIAEVYVTDPTYIRNYLAEKAREPQLLNAACAFIAEVDAA
jgi:hypothetical protein